MNARRRINAMAVTLVVSTAVTSAIPALGQSRSPAPVALAAVTTVKAPAYSARTLVSVPQQVRFPSDGYVDLPYLKVTGTATAAALYLIPAHTRTRQAELAMFGRLPAPLRNHTVASFPHGDEVIPAGTYWLVTLHSPGTAFFTLRLPGLDGQLTVTPSALSSASMAVLRPPTTVSGAYAPTGTSGIVNRRLTGTGFIAFSAGVALPVGGVSHTETCMYPGGGDLPAQLNLAPGCSDGSTVGSTAVQGTFSYTSTAFLNWDAGRYGAALDYQASNSPTGVAGWAAWVPYDG